MSVAFLLLFLASAPQPRPLPPSRPPTACEREIGRKAAAALIGDCRDVLGRRPSLCRPERPCEAIRAEIRSACEGAGPDAGVACGDAGELSDEEEADG